MTISFNLLGTVFCVQKEVEEERRRCINPAENKSGAILLKETLTAKPHRLQDFDRATTRIAQIKNNLH